ncbi:DUF167 domain-containing protein [Ruegeria sp. 2205SS24-7]|uniref:DUF167 domain-containing protein n=1 Tax=Ruegeria discodermiae TaxID=3064389 RepID=UPI00274271C5|nr:DUF167 domain-containing protein [Ruegeria sp. 2205SS24-7]MDP5219279.1 DUF167 domain-containing protein [Ruegeria sp. 2205SS24-7]
MGKPKTKDLVDLRNLAVPGAEITLHVTPRAARNSLIWRDGMLRTKVIDPPVDGRANDAVCALLARAMGVAPSRLNLVRGQSARDKTFR